MTGRNRRKILSRGQIRVDARRAVAKLRQHLLVDLHGYALEIARAAVIGGATKIALTHDTDDLFIAFDGTRIDADDAARLLDYVLTTTEDGDGARLRRLALAVNAALGLEPAFIDLYSKSPSGETFRVRFDASSTDDDDGKRTRARATSLPSALATGGQGVHVRRRFGWAVVQRFFTGAVPREVTLLIDACGRLPIPLTVSGSSMDAEEPSRIVVRAPLSTGPASRGFVEIHEIGSVPPVLAWHERGVRMLSTSLAPTESLAQHANASYLPVSGWVDADDLPTNASRSALRDDDPWVRQVADEALAATEDALEALIHAVTGEGDLPARVEMLTDDKSVLERALGGFVGTVFLSREPVPEAFRRVLRLPLYEDATGTRRSLAWIVERQAERPLLALSAKTPVSEDLHPWARDVMLLRGTVADRVLLDMPLGSGADRLERASPGARRRRSLLAQPARQPSLDADDSHLFHERFAYEEGPCRGLRGEVALPTASSQDPNALATVQVYCEGHLLESLVLRRDEMPLPVVAAIAWDDQLMPTFEYDGVQRDAALTMALNQVRRLAAHTAAELMARHGGDVMRHAVRAAVLSDPALLGDPKLMGASVWPTADGGWHTTQRVMQFAVERAAICFVRHGFEGPRAPDGRPVLVLAPHEHAVLPKLLGANDLLLVPYEAGLLRAQHARPVLAKAMRGAFYEALGSAEPQPPILVVRAKLLRAFVAPSPEPRLVWGHAGIPLQQVAPPPHLAPTTIALDDDRLVPSPMWDAVAWPREAPSTEAMERALFDTLVGALSGDERSRSGFVRTIDPRVLKQKVVRRFLCRAAASLLGQEALTEDARASLKKLDRIRILRVLDERGRIRRRSPFEVEKTHDGGIVPWLRERPGFETGDWHPVLVGSEAELVLLMARFGAARLHPAEADLEERRRRVALKRLEEQVLLRAPLGAAGALESAHADGPVARVDGRSSGAPQGGYAFSMALLEDDAATSRCQVLYCGRAIATLAVEAPVLVTARFDVFDATLLDQFQRLSTAGSMLFERAVHHAIRSLAALVVADTEPNQVPWWLQSTSALQLLDYAMTKDRETAVNRGLSEVAWPTIQGESSPLRRLAKRGQTLFFGTQRYLDWAPSTSGLHALDRPVLWMPPAPTGPLLRSLLTRNRRSLRDVTRAVHKLQHQRATGSEVRVPKLREQPEADALRATFGALGVAAVAGELEIIRAHPSSLDVMDVDGATRRIPCPLPFPVRAVAQSELFEVGALTEEGLVEEVGKAAIRHLRLLTPRLGELPTWLRGHVRQVVCGRAGAKAHIAKRDRRAPIFEDTRGEFHSMDSLSLGPVAFTSAEVRSSVQLEGRDVVLRLTPRETSELADALTLEDVTPLLRRAEEAERRRGSPEVPTALMADVRSACLVLRTIEAGPMTAELGLLAPGQKARGGITIHTGRRVLCQIEAGDGWPVAAVVNDDTLKPNEFFDGPGSLGDVGRIRFAVRAAAKKALAELTGPPEDALASLRVEWEAPKVRGCEPCRIEGWVWLPAVWPVEPKLRVMRHDQSKRLTRRASVATLDSVRDVVPIDGKLAVVSGSGEVPWGPLDAHLAVQIMHLVETLKPTDEAVLAYRWNLVLLGMPPTDPPRARAADGRALEAQEIVAELTKRKVVWLTDQRGHADGLFPEDAPSFVLPRGTPLAHVLQHRANVRELGALTDHEIAASELDSAADDAEETDSAVDAAAVAQPPDLDELAKAAASDDSVSLFEGLRRSVLRIARDEPPKPTMPSDPLALTFQALLPYLVGLPSELRIAYGERGRLVRYDVQGRTVLVNRHHECLRNCTDLLDDRACIAIAAAAVAELTREHRVMSAAEERRALLSLLGPLGP